MNIDDLKYVFKPQLDHNGVPLYFMLEDDGCKIIKRHPPDDLESLVVLLDCFAYAETVKNTDMPRFVKHSNK